MRLTLALTGISIVFASACGTVTPQADASGQGGGVAGSSGQAGSGPGGATAGTAGHAGNTAGATGQGGAVAGTTGQAGTGPGGTTGIGGRGGQAGGRAGTTGTGGRGGQGGDVAGTAGRGGASGTAGRGGEGGQTDGGVGCSDLEAEYPKAVAEARMCNPEAAGQCQMLVNTGLGCPLCQVRVNDATRPNQIRMQWTKQGCTPPIVCPQVICVSPGAGMCIKTDAGGSGGMCTMLATPGPI